MARKLAVVLGGLAAPGRRTFLRAGALSLAALALPWLTRAGDPRLAVARRLRMLHVHTGERIDVTYFEGGALVPAALAEVDRFLRDFRTGDVHAIDPGVLDVVWRVAGDVGRPRETLEIVCGYRSPRTNALLRARGRAVASRSLHLEGRAIDLRVPGVPVARVRDAALALRRGGVGFYPESVFVHVDTGRVRRW
jgi:uncharacterized protein YcbK (DUF882 family)